MRTEEQIRIYEKEYRDRNKEKRLEYQRIYRKKNKMVTKPVSKLYKDTDNVLKSIPNPFGSFGKSKYILFKNKSATEILYSFVTTCHNTEECIDIMKEKFVGVYSKPKYCCIYKIQNGVRKLIFKEIV